MAGVAVTVAVLLLAAGCSRKDDGSGAAPEEDVDVFRAAIVRPASLDPARARTIDELLVADQLFDPLTSHDPSTSAPVPALAASWAATPDQLQWEFTLRPDARFGDGSPITSADVKATLDRIARKDSGSSVNDLLDLVTGYREVAIDATATELSGVTAPAPNVVRIALESPWSLLPSVLASPAFGVLPKGVADLATFPEGGPELATSGPFLIDEATPDRLSLVPAPGVTAEAAGVDFVLFDDKAAAFDALTEGEVDWSEVPPDRIDEAAERFGRDLFVPYAAELFYAFNLRNPKFADVRFREAVVRAVDRSAILTEVYGGTVRPLAGAVVEGLESFQPEACAGRCAFDRPRARELLAEIVAAGGTIPEVAIDFEDDAIQTAVATAIRDDLAEVGISASLRPKPLEEYQQFAVSGDQELFRLGWVAPYPSADAILTPLFLTGFPNNLTGFSSATVDELLRAARADPDPAARVARWQEAERAVLAEVPIVPIGQFELHAAASARVRGLTMTLTGTFDAREVSVAAATAD